MNQDMKLERTHDMNIVREILSHPAIFKHIHDDNSTQCDPIDHEGFYWMLASDVEPLGVFLVHALNSVCFEVHTCLLPSIWGARAAIARRLLLTWLFNETACEKLVTNVPAYNRAALRFARAGGMTQEGVNRESFLHGGKLQDLIILGITKKEWLCQQSSQ